MLYNLVLIDTPGDPAYAQNMIGEVSKGDIAVLVVSSNLKEFEDAFSSYKIQSYILLALAMSIEQFLVVINFKELKNNKEDEHAYNKIKDTLSGWLTDNGINLMMTPFVPVVALEGENIKYGSDKFPFYFGNSLEMELLSQRLPDRFEEKPLRLPVSKIIEVNEDSVVLEGSIETGELKKGMRLRFSPGIQEGEVTDIKFFGEPMDIGESGNYITFTVTGANPNEIKRGQVASDLDNKFARTAYQFDARVVIANSKEGIREGEEYEMHFNTIYANCTIDMIRSKIVRGKEIDTNDPIRSYEAALITIVPPIDTVVVDLYKEFPSCGKFAIRNKNGTIAGFGIILDIIYGD